MNSRQAFEKWAQSQQMSIDRWSASDHNTEYTSVQTLRAWLAWQAATERAKRVCDAVEDRYGQAEDRLWPEMRTDAKTGAAECSLEISEGNQ